MALPPRLVRVIAALGLAEADAPPALESPGPFGAPVLDLEAAVAWLAVCGAARPDAPDAIDAALAAAGPATDGLTVRLRATMLRALAPSDAAAAVRIAHAVPAHGPLESTLRLGALARLSALVATAAPEADAAVMWAAPLLTAPRPVARLAALRLAEIGLTDGPLGRRARAVLEEGLTGALEAAHVLGAAGQLAALLEHGFAERVVPGMPDRVAAAGGKIVDLVGVLGGLAAHRAGLAARLAALAPQAPAFAGPGYVAAYLAALGAADRGPYLHEVHDQLARAAADADPRVRALALDALRGHVHAEPALVDAAIEALSDAESAVRAAAALALGARGAASAAAAHELADLVRLGELEEALAGAYALVRCGRPIPAAALAERDEPVLRAAVALLERPDDEAAFAALCAARVEAGLANEDAIDERVRPRDLLIGALRGWPVERAAAWIARFAAGELLAAGEIWFHALDGVAPPRELVDAGAPLIAAITGDDAELAALAALVAARLMPDDPRLEELILERTTPPVAWIALGALARLTEGTAELLVAIADGPDPDHAALAIEALGCCALASDRAHAIGAALARHVRDDDPLAEAAYGALLALVERGALTA